MTELRAKLLVVGCASRDLIHLELLSQSVCTMGGAGLYTTIAAAVAGAQCTLLAPQADSIEQFDFSLPHFEWIGPKSKPANFPYLEIRHHGNDRATLVDAAWGDEELLVPGSLPDLDSFAIVHIAALSSARKQLDFLKAIRAKSNCKISLGTYARLAYNETETVRTLVRGADFVFMNENEAKAIFNDSDFPLSASAEQIIAITLGRNGARIHSQNALIHLAGLPVDEVDPTGAGDTFAGTMLAGILQKLPLQICAENAIKQSALVITKPGPNALL